MFKAIAVCLFLLSPSAYSSDSAKMYKLLGEAPVGSNMRPVEAKSLIPFAKRFHQLSDKQRKIYRTNFPGIEDNEVPPFPLNGFIELYKPIIKGHARTGGGGDLTLLATIDKEGNVDSLAIYSQPSKKLGDLATTVMFNTKFKPATCDGEPCEMQFQFEFPMRHRFKSINSLDKENFGKLPPSKIK